MSPSIDFTNVPSLDPVPDGVYQAEVVHAEEGMSKTGNPKIDLRWKIVGGEFDGRQIFDTMSFHPDALWRTKLTLQGMGFSKDFSGDVGASDLVGLTAELVVIKETGRKDQASGEDYPDRNKITRVRRQSGDVIANLLS